MSEAIEYHRPLTRPVCDYRVITALVQMDKESPSRKYPKFSADYRRASLTVFEWFRDTSLEGSDMHQEACRIIALLAEVR